MNKYEKALEAINFLYLNNFMTDAEWRSIKHRWKRMYEKVI